VATSCVIGDILAMRAWSVLDEQAAVNTYNYECISISGGAVTDQDFCSTFDTGFMSPFYQALQPPSVEYRGVQAYFIKRSSGALPAPVSSTAGAHVGTHGTKPVTRNAAPILKYAGFSRGPGGRGRVYLPFVSDDYIASNGRVTNAFDVLVNSVASTLLTPIVITSGGSTATFAWGVAKRPRGGPVTISQILTAQSADRVGQMHKRGDYGRANASPI